MVQEGLPVVADPVLPCSLQLAIPSSLRDVRRHSHAVRDVHPLELAVLQRVLVYQQQLQGVLSDHYNSGVRIKLF